MEEKNQLVTFLEDILHRKKVLPSQMASSVDVSHVTVLRWLSGKDLPNTRSCQKLAKYSGVPLEKILSMAGHIEHIEEKTLAEWPEFREYACRKYPDELDDDLITMIEDLIERKRNKKRSAGKDS